MQKFAWLATAMALACAACASTPASAADQVGYQIGNGNTNTIAVDPSHGLPVNCVTGCSGGGGGGGAITAAAGSYAVGSLQAGSVTDLGTGPSPAANTVNAYLKAVQALIGAAADTPCSSTVKTVLGCGYALVQAATSPIPTQSPTVNIGAVGISQTTPGTTNGVQTLSGSVTTATLGAGTAIAGKFGIDQTTPGTTNGVQTLSGSVTTATLGAGANVAGGFFVDYTNLASAAISTNTAATTQLVALSSGKAIYVTSFDILAAGAANITFEYGTGTNCGTGTTVLTGAYNLTAQAGVAKGSGIAPVLVVPASNALCVVNSAAVQVSGSVSYVQR